VINHFQSPWQLKWLFGAQGHEVALVAVAVSPNCISGSGSGSSSSSSSTNGSSNLVSRGSHTTV